MHLGRLQLGRKAICPPEERPQQAIDAFLDLHFDELHDPFNAEGQMIVAKPFLRIASKHLNSLTFRATSANLMRYPHASTDLHAWIATDRFRTG